MEDGMEGMTGATEARPGKRPLTEEDTPEGGSNTLHVPLEFLQGTKFKEGDELVLKVVAVDEEGLEAAYAKAPRSASSASAELDSLDNSQDY